MNAIIKATTAAVIALSPAALLADNARVTAQAPDGMTAGETSGMAAHEMRVVEDGDFVLAERASNWMGLDVIDPEGETLGAVNDVFLDSGYSVIGIEVGVGGFLGIGETDVLIPLDRISVVVDEESESVTLTASVTRDELEELTADDS